MEQDNSELKIFIEQAKNGDKSAFKEIFDRMNDKFFNYAFSRTSNRQDALDVVQDTFIDLWKSLKRFKYESDEGFYGFMFKIAKAKIARCHRKNRKTLPLNETNLQSVSQEPGFAETNAYLATQINSLSSMHQDIIRLRYWSQMTFKEIAAALNITETNAKVRHHRALRQLKINLNDKDYAI